MMIPTKAENIYKTSNLLIFSFKKTKASTAVHMGQVKNMQLAVETGIYLTAVT